AKYREDGQPIDLSTTPDLELRRQLRFDFHNPAAKIPEPERQLGYDSVDFTLERATGKECVLVFRDDAVELRKTVKTTERPYELVATATIRNLASNARRHALTVETTAWRTEAEEIGRASCRESGGIAARA